MEGKGEAHGARGCRQTALARLHCPSSAAVSEHHVGSQCRWGSGVWLFVSPHMLDLQTQGDLDSQPDTARFRMHVDPLPLDRHSSENPRYCFVL